MSAKLNICHAKILENPAPLETPLKLEIQFEAYEDIAEEVDWELSFVGTDGKVEHDQELDSLTIGPIKAGVHRFTFDAPAPNLEKLSSDDLMDVTLLQLQVKYKEQPFIHISWFVAHRYTDPELIENPPSTPIIAKMERMIITDDVRVTTFAIKWDDGQEEHPPEVEPENSDAEDEDETEKRISDQFDESATISSTHSMEVDKQQSSKDEEEQAVASPQTNNEEVSGSPGKMASTGAVEPLVDMTNSNQ